jgi:hypothetical protein
MCKVIALLFFCCSTLGMALPQVPATEKQFLDTAGSVTISDDGKPPVGLPTTLPIRTLENSSALFNIRCWQKGQLILEESNWSSPQLSNRYISLKKIGSTAPGMYLVDFIETFCELKQQ